MASGKVAASLYKRATGYERESVKLFQHQGQIVEGKYIEHHPPDTAAASFWLTNRAPDLWKDRREVVDDKDYERRIMAMTDDERRAEARSLVEEVRARLREDAERRERLRIEAEATDIAESEP